MENLEKNIKDKLQQNKISIDTDELWKEVYPRIKPKRNRRALLFILSGLVWATSLFIVGYYFRSDGQQEVVELSVDADAQLEKTASTTVINKAVNNKKVSEVKKFSELETLTAEESSVVSKRTQKPSKSERDSKSDSEQTLESNAINEPRVRNLKKRNHSEYSNTNSPINNSQVIVNKLNEVKTSPSIERTEIKDSEPIIINAKSNNLTIQKNIMLEDIVDEEKKLKNIRPAALKNYTIPRLKFEYPQPNIPNDFYAAHKDPTSSSKLSLYLRGGIYATSRSLTARENMSSIDLDQRTNAESPLESLSGELGFSYQLRPNLSISAGLSYTRVNEKIQDSYSVIDTVLLENVIIENIISSRGSEPVFGNIRSARTVNTNLTAYNRYSDIALSVDLTYLLKTQGIKPYLTAGIQQSISSSQSGYWLINTNDLYDLSQDPNSYLSSTYGLGLRIGAGVDLDLSDKSSLRIGGRYTRYFDSITSDAYSLKQKYNLLGLSAGLNIKI